MYSDERSGPGRFEMKRATVGLVIAAVAMAQLGAGPAETASEKARARPAVGLGQLQFQSQDHDWKAYGRQLYWIVWKQWDLAVLRAAEAGEIDLGAGSRADAPRFRRVTAVLSRNGGVASASLEKPSTLAAVDRAALRMIEGIPTPPLPSTFPRSQETVSIDLYLDPRVGLPAILEEVRNRIENVWVED